MAGATPRRDEEDLVADRDRLIEVGMAAVFVACVVFGGLRLAMELATGHATPWWGNVVAAVLIVPLFFWYRAGRATRSAVAVHGTALLATVALTIPAAYGMSSSKWWLALVGFSVLLMGHKVEAIVWSALTLVLLPTLAVVEGRLTVENAIGEPAVERAMAGLFFLLLLFGVTLAFRRAARARARELVETAASLDRANQVKTRFLAHMSHEIRTPLHGVIAMTDLALQEAVSEPVREQIRAAQQSARTLLGILTNVLDVTRAGSGALSLDPRPFDLHAALGDVLRPLGVQARARGLDFVALAGADVVAQRTGDRVRLGQVVGNLVTNALKFTDQGTITVELEAVGSDRVRLRVSDTGRGIPAEKLHEIFEPFVQASSADQQVQGGVGLGLAIVRELVTRMDGEVEVESKVGVGSTFSVVVSLPPGEDTSPGPHDLLTPGRDSSRLPVPTGREPLEVLVCEDNVVNQRVLVAMLSRLGHRVTMAADGEAGWELLEARSFRLVITDLEMPGLGGVELTARLRAREADTGALRTPVIGATAHVGEDELHRLLDQGMDAHLGKPFTLLELSSVIERVTAVPDAV